MLDAAMLAQVSEASDEHPEERKRRSLNLTLRAWIGLDHLAARNGISRTGLLEALGRHARTTKLPQKVIDEARDIDRERRAR